MVIRLNVNLKIVRGLAKLLALHCVHYLLQNSVGRYPMHSLNSGFSGSLIPTKDLKVVGLLSFVCSDTIMWRSGMLPRNFSTCHLKLGSQNSLEFFILYQRMI